MDLVDRGQTGNLAPGKLPNCVDSVLNQGCAVRHILPLGLEGSLLALIAGQFGLV